MKGDSLEDLVVEVQRKGLTCVQLALKKSLVSFNLDNGSITPGFAHYVGEKFRQHHIQIAVIGCYINMIHPNQEIRRKELEYFKENIRYARDFGCSIVGTETGNVLEEIKFTKDNFKEEPFQEVVKSVKELVEEAEKFGVIVGIEGGVNHPIYNPKVMKRLLDMINSNNLQVIFDPVNFLTVENYKNQKGIFEEAMELFGDRIIVMHAKDFVIENNSLKIVPVGQGLLNYKEVFKLLKPKKPFINVLLEETKEPYIDGSISYLQEIYNEL